MSKNWWEEDTAVSPQEAMSAVGVAQADGQQDEGNWWEQDAAVRADVGPEAVLAGIEADKKRQEELALLHEANQSIETYGEIPTVASQIVTDIASPVERLIGMGDRADEVNRKSDILSQALSERDRAAWRADESPEGMSTLEQAGQYIPFLKNAVRGAARSLGSAVLGSKGGGALLNTGKIAAGATRGAVAGGVAGAAQGAGIAARGALAAGGGSAAGAIGLASAQEANRAITEGADAGLKGSALAGYVASQGIIEALPATVMQRLGLGGVEAMISGPAIRGGIKAGFTEAIKATGQEIPEELATEVLHAVASEYSGVDRQALDSDRLSSLVADTILQTVLMGAGAGAMRTASGAMQARDEQRLARLQEIRSKGFVSAEDAKEAGIEGKNRKERKANLDKAIEQEASILPPLPQGVPDASQVPTNETRNDVQGNGGKGSQVDSGSQVRVEGQNQGGAKQPSQEPATPQVQVEPSKQVQGEIDDNQLRIFKDGKWRNATVTAVNEDDGWRVKHVKVTDPETGMYEWVPFPDKAAKGYSSYEQARDDVLAVLKEKYKEPEALPAPQQPKLPAPKPTEATNPVDPVSELDQAGDELAGLFGQEETPAPTEQPKPPESPKGSRFEGKTDAELASIQQMYEDNIKTKKAKNEKVSPEWEKGLDEVRALRAGANPQTEIVTDTSIYGHPQNPSSREGQQNLIPIKFGSGADLNWRNDEIQKRLDVLQAEIGDTHNRALRGKTPAIRKKASAELTSANYSDKEQELKDLREAQSYLSELIKKQNTLQPKETPSKSPELTPPAVPESKWSSETRAKLESVPALKGAKVESDEKAGTVKVTRPDGLATTIQFNADEELAAAAKQRGRKPESVHGWYIRKPGEKQGRILIHSDANHSNILNHEVMHWLEDSGVVTKEEVEQYGGREAIAEKYGKWAELKQRKKDSVFQRIYDALEPVFSSQARFFEEVGSRKAETKSPEDHAKIPMFGVYKTTLKGKTKFAVKEFENKGFGDSLFDTEAEANKQSGIAKRQSDEKTARQEKAKVDEEAAVKKQQEYEGSFQGFLSDTPMVRGRQLSTLGKQRNYQGKVVTVKELIEQKVSDGAIVNEDGQLESPDGAYLGSDKITKIGIDYARHLIARKPTQASADQVNVDSGEESKVKPEDELASLRAKSEKMYDEVERLQNTGKDQEANVLLREAEKITPRIKELEAPMVKARQADAAAKEEERRKEYNAKEDARKAALPTKQSRNGWELATDGARWYLRDPNTKEIIYEGKLKRVREVADEAAPDVPTNEAADEEARAERDAKLRERLKTLDYDNLRKLNKDAVIQVGDETISDIGGLALEELNRRMDEAEQPTESVENNEPTPKPYPERPNGETGDELIKRIAGREWHEVTKADFLRWAAGEYLAGGARKDKLVDDYKLGTEEQRRKFHEQAVTSAIKEGKYVPPEVLADYSQEAKDEPSKGAVEVVQILKNAVRFSVNSKIPESVPQTRSKRTDGVEYIEVTNPNLDRIPNAKEAIALRKQQAEKVATKSETNKYGNTPIGKLFAEAKAAGGDTMLMFRMGDFYELYFEDAQKAAKMLGLTLTTRDKSGENPVPMAGFPYHQLDGYLKKLKSAGIRVAVNEEPFEKPKKAKAKVEPKATAIEPPKKEAVKSEPVPIEADFMEMSNGVNAPGVKQTIRVTAGERTLVMERSKHDSEWSIKEAEKYTGEVKGKSAVKKGGELIVSGIAETKKAKEIAQRIIDGTFDKDYDKRFVREDTQNIGLTNAGLAESMKDSLVRRDSFAKLLRETGLATDGRLLMKVSDKDRDAILKAVGETLEGRPLNTVAQMMTDGQKALSRSANAMKPIGYRGGYLTPRTVVLQSQDGDSAILDKVLHDTILKKYPDAVPYFKEEGGPVSYASNDDLIAIVMPMNMDKPDAKVKELVAGKYDFEAEASEAAKFPPPQSKTKLKKAAEKANKELANAVDEFGNVIKGKLGSNLPLNPEVIAAAAKVVAKAIKAGTLNFAELMERMVTKYGEPMAERMRGVLQQEWDKQVNSNPIAEDGIPPETPQPHPELVKPEPIPLTSVKNAIVDELRVQRGEDPMPEVTPQTVQQWLEAAGNRIANDPYAGNTLVEQLLTGSKTSVDEMEGMVLQYHYRAVNNLFTAADAKLTEAKANGEPAEIAVAQDEARVIMRRLAAIETALDKAGTAWGRAGVSRQVFLKQDFSLASMVRRARVANGGNELTDAQVAIISEQAKKIEELQKQLAELEAKIEANAKQEQEKVIDDAIKKDIEETKKPPVAKPKSRTRLKAEARIASAWEKFGAASSKKYSNIDPGLLLPAIEVVKAYVDLGVVTFREFMSAAVQNIGAKDARASEPTFRAAWDQLKEEGETAQPELDLSNLGKLTRFAKQVQRTMVESGITEREEVVDAVHEALQEFIPEITRRQTMDALSSYGQFAQLSKDPIDQIIRDINGQLQQLAKLEDMEKGQAPAKTGVERRSPTDEERRLTQLVNEAKRRGGFVVTDPETQLKSAMGAAKTAVKNRIADMNYEIKTGSRVVRNKSELIPDAELEQLRKDRDELQKVHKEMFPPKGATEAQKIASASRALDAAIASLEAKLAVGDISPAPQQTPLSTPELDAKRARLKQLHEQRDALRKIANPNMTDEQKKIRSLDRSIEALEDQLATGDFSPKPKPAPLTSPEIDARQAKLEELRATKKAILDAINPKMTPEQRASRAYEAHLRKQLAMYLEKIAQGDFAPKPKKQPRVLTQGELDLKKKLADVKHDFFEALSKYHLDNLSPGGRAIDIVRESAHLSRAIMTSIDLSAVLRQGGLGVYSHPAMARKAAGEMWHAIWSREKEFQSMEKLQTRPNAQLYEESGLNITDSEGKLTRQEEAFMGRWARTGIDFAGEKVQAVSKLALEPVAASARAYVTFINNLRADLFDVLVENLGPGGQVTKEEAKLIAKYINVATGRADLKALNDAAATLNTVFFAPRYVASRFQYLAMPFYLMGTKDSGRVKKLIAKEYARTFTGATVFLGSLTVLAYLAAGGDEEKPSLEINPLSSDFGKLRIDETRLDPLAGLAQVIVVSSRLAAFRTKSSVTGKIKPFYEGGPYETTHASEAWRFLRTKFAPVPGAVVTAFSGMKDVVGEEVTPAGLVGGLFVPLSVGEVLSTMQHRGIPKGTALTVLNLMGAAVNTYGPKTAYLDATPEERAKQVNDYIKYMNWESDLPAFSPYLQPEDLKRVQDRQNERRGDLVFEAMAKVLPKNEYKTEVHYEEAQERHDKVNEAFEDFRKQYAPTFTDAVRYLTHHFDDEGGIKIKGMRKAKPSFIERKASLELYYQSLPE